MIVQNNIPVNNNISNTIKGTYKIIVGSLNVRENPYKNAKIIKQLHQGDIIDLDNYNIETDGYLWGRHTNIDDTYDYIAICTINGRAFVKKIE